MHISKILNKFVHVIDIDKANLKSRLDYVWAYVGCKKLSTIPKQFNAIIRRYLCRISIVITCKIGGLEICLSIEKTEISTEVHDPKITRRSTSVGV